MTTIPWDSITFDGILVVDLPDQYAVSDEIGDVLSVWPTEALARISADYLTSYEHNKNVMYVRTYDENTRQCGLILAAYYDEDLVDLVTGCMPSRCDDCLNGVPHDEKESGE